jgi:hypothetical protein
MPTIGDILLEMVFPRIEKARSQHQAKELSAAVYRISKFFADDTPEQVTREMLDNYRRYNGWDDPGEGRKALSKCGRDLRLMRQAVLTHAKKHQTKAPHIFEGIFFRL